MAHVMTVLMRVADAWVELARASAPDRFTDDDRVEVLGTLVRLVARRWHGFRELPEPEDIVFEVKSGGIELRLRSPRRVPFETELIERQLAKFGFTSMRVPGTDSRELLLTCGAVSGATILEFIPAKVAAARRKRR
jgi:hypothetical protein